MKLDELMEEFSAWSKARGYWDNTSIGEHIAYLHSEVSELFEAYRKGPNKPCDKGIDLTAEEEEAADIYMILMELVSLRKINLERAVAMKFEFNKGRPKKNPPVL